MGRHPRLHFETLVAEGGDGPGGTAQQRLKDARLACCKTFDMAGEFINPDRDLEPIGRRHRMLTMSTARQRHVF